MTERTAQWVAWSGGALIVAAGVAALVLNVLFGESVFAARLVAGMSGCL